MVSKAREESKIDIEEWRHEEETLLHRGQEDEFQRCLTCSKQTQGVDGKCYFESCPRNDPGSFTESSKLASPSKPGVINPLRCMVCTTVCKKLLPKLTKCQNIGCPTNLPAHPLQEQEPSSQDNPEELQVSKGDHFRCVFCSKLTIHKFRLDKCPNL